MTVKLLNPTSAKVGVQQNVPTGAVVLLLAKFIVPAGIPLFHVSKTLLLLGSLPLKVKQRFVPTQVVTV